MKTAIQELKEHIEQMIHHGGDPDLICVLELINSEYILKEKHQITDAVKYGFNDAIKPLKYTDNTFDDYYDKTFNHEIQ